MLKLQVYPVRLFLSLHKLIISKSIRKNSLKCIRNLTDIIRNQMIYGLSGFLDHFGIIVADKPI